MSWTYKDGFSLPKNASAPIESEHITRVAAAAPAPRLTIGKIALAVFFGNLMTAVVGGLVYLLVTAK
jgi:hypothetical protein